MPKNIIDKRSTLHWKRDMKEMHQAAARAYALTALRAAKAKNAHRRAATKMSSKCFASAVKWAPNVLARRLNARYP
jgi:hypothetical protein